MAQPFIDAVDRSGVCYDTGSPYDDEGRLRYLTEPTPLDNFVREQGDAAIPFYREVIAGCENQSWRADAFRALGLLGTSRAVSLLEKHARAGEHDRSDAAVALLAAPNFAQSATVAARLRDEPDRWVRFWFATWLTTHGDRRALPALREALARETDPEAAWEERTAIALIEDPLSCVFAGSRWEVESLGRQCGYICRGVDATTATHLWRGLLPCPAKVSRGRHFTVSVAPWRVSLVLFANGLAMLIYPGLIQGVIRRRAVLWRRPATRSEGLWFGLVWCAASLVPLGAAAYIWVSRGISLGITNLLW